MKGDSNSSQIGYVTARLLALPDLIGLPQKDQHKSVKGCHPPDPTPILLRRSLLAVVPVESAPKIWADQPHLRRGGRRVAQSSDSLGALPVEKLRWQQLLDRFTYLSRKNLNTLAIEVDVVAVEFGM